LVDAGHVARALLLMPITTSSEVAREAFLEGRRLSDNNRQSESLAKFSEAVAADPDFALAWSYMGSVTAGDEGLAMVRRAQGLSAKLPEGERLWVELQLARVEGRQDDAIALARQLVLVIPDEWRVLFEMAQMAYDRRDFERATAGYRRAMSLSVELSSSCLGFNNLGYAQAMIGHLEQAISALTKCVALNPSEPNPWDSLGEIQLAAGRFEESRESFGKALALSKAFIEAERGIAAVEFAQGRYEAGQASLARARADALRSTERASIDLAVAWATLAHGDEKAAFAALERAERELKREKVPAYWVADVAASRAAMLNLVGRRAAAAALVGPQLAALEKADRVSELAGIVRHRLHAEQVLALAKTDLPASRRALDVLLEEIAANTATIEVDALGRRARAAVLEASGDHDGALGELAGCQLLGLSEYTLDDRVKPHDTRCLLDRAELLIALHRDGADPLLERLATFASRDPVDVLVQQRAIALRKRSK
jgi:tetratricopeptide (TPR) repeat protein